MDASQRQRIIVGVDYGTTFSGVSWAWSETTKIDDINVISTWPGNDGVWKVATRIAYESENPDAEIETEEWGFRVPTDAKSYTWTKLLLDKNASTSKFDDESLLDLYGEGLMNLPPNKTAQDVVEDFLRHLRKYLMQRLEKEVGSDILKLTPMDCYFTMPALWSDQAQIDTWKAAKAAGFASRDDDTLSMIPEPQAAAIAAFKPKVGPQAKDLVKPGENILVCDCGGGTVDIISYKITATEPVLDFEELCIGIGGKCGSTTIDRNFNKWMVKMFGDFYLSVNPIKRGAGSEFMESFNRSKRSFQGTEKRIKKIAPIKMDVSLSKSYDREELSVILTPEVMRGLFDPVIDSIIGLIDTQIQTAKAGNSQINRVVLVGGFAASDYLITKVKKWSSQNGIDPNHVINPTNSQAAIVRGAVLRGLEGTQPSIKYCRFHYGWSWGFPFREGIDSEQNAYIEPFHKTKLCSGRMKWVVSKGQKMNEEFTSLIPVANTGFGKGSKKSVLDLYYCDLDTPPEREEHQGVRKVGTINLNLTDIKPEVKEGTQVFMYSAEIKIHFRGANGILNFKGMKDGKSIGNATIEV